MTHLTTGTVIEVDFGIFKHPAIVSDRWFGGKPMLLSNSCRQGGVVEEDWSSCIGNRRIRTVGFPGNLSPEEVLARARSKSGEKWNLFTWNCEHFVHWAHGLRQQSPQLRSFVTISFVFLAVIALSTKQR
jgi:hypothetical protein